MLLLNLYYQGALSWPNMTIVITLIEHREKYFCEPVIKRIR